MSGAAARTGVGNPLPVSIIVPTFMRNQVLWRSLEGLRGQLREGDEILVVDQNRPPLRAPGPWQAPWLRLLWMGRPSLTRARNLGLAEARRSHVVFLDDDIIPAPDLLERLKEAALLHPGCIITGQVEQEDKPADVASPGHVDLRKGEIRTNFSRPLDGEVPFFPGGLNLIPKACLPPPPCFCPAFKGAAQGEEIDFAFRAKARGVKIFASSKVKIHHLRIVEGGCRAPEFQRRFFLDHVFNRSLFFGRHGSLVHGAAFLASLKGFVEFHSRTPGRSGGAGKARKGHSPGLVLKAMGQTVSGLWQGLWLRRS